MCRNNGQHMDNIEVNKDLFAYCGLYCGACRQYLAKKCVGCMNNEKATWCKIRTCCKEKQISNCAGCAIDAGDCKQYTNLISKAFSYLFNSNRPACIRMIKEVGEEAFAARMAQARMQTLKRK